MSSDLVNYEGEVPERFVPDLMRGDLAEAEHFNRYYWAAALLEGRRVLDAGCGTAYGSVILAGAASSVVGVDIAEAVLEAMRPTMPEGVSLEHGDLRSLRYGEGAFDAVVCFEAIEHVEEPAVVLDELRRVLAHDGLLVISSPNREAYVPGNPHHHHEFEPEELRRELRKRFDHVALFRQSPWIMSAILNDEEFAAGAGAKLERLPVRKVVAGQPGSETYTIAMASSAPLPDAAAQAVLTHAAELRRWMELFEEQQALIRSNIDRADELQARDNELSSIRRELLVAEQTVAASFQEAQRLAEAEARVEHLEQRVAERDGLIQALEDRLAELEQEFVTSASWRLTAPVRKAGLLAKRALRP